MKKFLTSLLFLLLACGTLSAADITQSSLLSASNGSAATVFTTASVSPPANKLLLLSVSAQRIGADPSEPTVAGNGLTWVRIATILNPASNDGRLTLFRAMGGSPSTGTIVITFSEEQANASWMLSEFGNIDTGGSNGANAVVQFASNQESGTNPSVALSAFSNANNATYATVQNLNGIFVTEGSGFTEINDINVLALQTQWRNDNDTTITWTGGNAGWVSVAIEIKNATQAVHGVNLTSLNTQSDAAGYSTVSVSPTGNALILTTVVTARGSSVVAPTTVTGNGLTWVKLVDVVYNSAIFNVSLWRAMGPSPTSGVITANYGATQLAQSIIVDEFLNVDTGGANGADAIVQVSIEEITAEAAPTHTLSAFSDTLNATFGFTGNLGEGIVAGTGFTELAEIGANAEVIQTQWRFDNDTTITWSDVSAGNENWGIGGVEIKIEPVVTGASVGVRGARTGFIF